MDENNQNEQLEEQQEQEQTTPTSKKKADGKGLTKDQRSTLKRLKDLPTKTILIPEDPINPDDTVVPIAVNGVIYAIPRGVECEVPDVIYDIWKESYQKTAAANKRIKIQQDRKLEILG